MSELAKHQLELSKSQAQFINETRTSLTNKAAQLRNLEVQMVQMASMFNERQQGNMLYHFGSEPETRWKEHYKSITLRSGKNIEKPVQGSRVENNAKNGENSD